MMTLEQVREAIGRRKLKLSWKGEEPSVDGPPEYVTLALVKAVRAHRDALRSSPPVPEPQPRLPPAWAADEDYEPDWDCCAVVWPDFVVVMLSGRLVTLTRSEWENLTKDVVMP